MFTVNLQMRENDLVKYVFCLFPIQLDLSSFKSVRKFADDFHSTGKPLHVLCDNGGFGNFNNERLETEDGFELHMGTNHLGNYTNCHHIN